MRHQDPGANGKWPDESATATAPAHPRSTAGFFRLEWRFLLFGLLVAFWSSPGQTFLISLFGRELREAFGLSHGDFGALYTLATLTSAACLLPAGGLIDRLPLAVFSRWVVLGLSAAALGLAFVAGPVSLFFAVFGLRFTGQGLMSHIALTAMARRYRQERGRALAVAALGHPLGEAIFPPLVVWALLILEWRFLWIGFAVLITLSLLPLLPVLLKRTDRQDGAGPEDLAAADASQRQWTRAELLRDPRFYLLTPLAAAAPAIGTGILFHQVHIVALKGWSLEWWGACFVLYALGSVFANLATGAAVDRVSARRLAPITLLPMIAYLIVLAIGDDPWLAALILALMGVNAGAAGVTLTALWAELYGTAHLGAIRALASALMVFASALGPVAMGALFDAEVTIAAIAYGCAAICLAAGVAATFALRRAQPGLV